MVEPKWAHIVKGDEEDIHRLATCGDGRAVEPLIRAWAAKLRSCTRRGHVTTASGRPQILEGLRLMASDYASIRAENERRYGTDIGRIGRILLADPRLQLQCCLTVAVRLSVLTTRVPIQEESGHG
jgi:hypothetical protein